MTLTIVMYHYVRDVERTPFAAIKARSVTEFRGQIEYLRRHYQVISPAEFLQAVCYSPMRLPANAALLTFDDGYIDHYETVFPILSDLHLSGVFAPVARAVLEAKVLEVNKIHFVLAAMQDQIGRVVQELFDLLDQHRSSYDLPANQAYWDRLARPSRFDPAEIIFLKRMLQRDLPASLRSRFTCELFRKYVTADEQAFVSELYMNEGQLREMSGCGMAVACHGYDHLWMGTLSEQEQSAELDKSLDFLARLVDPARGWIFTYPYGSHNPNLLDLARRKGCVAGFTTDVAIATTLDDPLRLPRLDTNDLPVSGDSPPGKWTEKARRNVL